MKPARERFKRCGGVSTWVASPGCHNWCASHGQQTTSRPAALCSLRPAPSRARREYVATLCNPHWPLARQTCGWPGRRGYRDVHHRRGLFVSRRGNSRVLGGCGDGCRRPGWVRPGTGQVCLVCNRAVLAPCGGHAGSATSAPCSGVLTYLPAVAFGPARAAAHCLLAADPPCPGRLGRCRATAETSHGPWSYLPARLSSGRRTAIFTTVHHSIFTVVGEDVTGLLGFFETQSLDGLRSGVTASVAQPACAGESTARSGYTVQSSTGRTVYWCFGTDPRASGSCGSLSSDRCCIGQLLTRPALFVANLQIGAGGGHLSPTSARPPS